MQQRKNDKVGETKMPNPKSKIRSGFTLIEILVVIGIIALLLAITFPVISRVRKAARVAAAKANMSMIQGAIENYQRDHGAYPGPIPDASLTRTGFAGVQTMGTPPAGFASDMGNGQAEQLTGTENLVLALCGGLEIEGTPAAPRVVYNPASVGKGASNLNFANLKRFPAYIESTNLSWRTENNIKTGHYVDGSAAATDSIIPELLDTFESPMPILYLRAKRGTNVVGPSDTGTPTQGKRFTVKYNPVVTNVPTPTATDDRVGAFDVAQFIGYTGADAQGNYIGEGKDIRVSDYTNTSSSGKRPHGLTLPDDDNTQLDAVMTKGDPKYQYPYNAFVYFKDPATAKDNAQPRVKDTFIIISAGLDRVYGTADDITSFGEVTE